MCNAFYRFYWCIVHIPTAIPFLFRPNNTGNYVIKHLCNCGLECEMLNNGSFISVITMITNNDKEKRTLSILFFTFIVCPSAVYHDDEKVSLSEREDHPILSSNCTFFPSIRVVHINTSVNINDNDCNHNTKHNNELDNLDLDRNWIDEETGFSSIRQFSRKRKSGFAQRGNLSRLSPNVEHIRTTFESFTCSYHRFNRDRLSSSDTSES
ncbi:hypothetical protein K501DRAFT_269110 [Backusella circina FSU 941]|nr:hypothetical protein K501DRAFT_269110 [Backusella circina FSU 941]